MVHVQYNKELMLSLTGPPLLPSTISDTSKYVGGTITGRLSASNYHGRVFREDLEGWYNWSNKWTIKFYIDKYIENRGKKLFDIYFMI